MIYLSVPQIVFIIVASIAVLAIIFCCIYFPSRSKYIKNNFKRYYHDTIYKIAVLDDYYLINNFIFKTGDSRTVTIDEMLIGEKYFYIITCLYFEGSLVGNETDSSLVYIPKLGSKKYTDNPFLETKKIIRELSLITGIDTSLMIGVVLVNDNCKVDVIEEKKSDGTTYSEDEKIFFFTKRKDFPKLIKELEKRDVGTINAEQLDRAVKGIDKMNRRKMS